MQKIDYEDLATVVAENVIPHLDKPTTPIIGYHKDGDNLSVVLNDGRKITASVELAKDMLAKKQQPALLLPTSKPILSIADPPANLQPDGKHRSSPKGDKAGK